MPDALNLGASGWDTLLQQAFDQSHREQRIPFYHCGLIPVALDGQWWVAAVLDGYPAQQAGVRRGDRLLDERVISRDGGPMTLSLARDGSPLQTTVMSVYEDLYDSYRSATLNSVQQFSNGNKVIGYVHLWGLSRAWGDLVTYADIIRSLSHCDGMILDLRDSTGVFAPEHIEPFVAAADPGRNAYRYYDREMVILQNSGSREGALAFIQALGSLQRVVTVGEATANGMVPEQTVLYPFTESVATDPQFQAGMMTLMMIM
ncbi:MAG: hypothetical protein RLZZ385_361 [Pseudomonadota bacterium]|jgi:carboxyl-terminal processing protease